MTEKDTGGPAFPIAPEGAYLPDCDDPGMPPKREFPGHPGMTLRDYFAAQALAELVSLISVSIPETQKVVAKLSYDMADAMIEARNA